MGRTAEWQVAQRALRSDAPTWCMKANMVCVEELPMRGTMQLMSSTMELMRATVNRGAEGCNCCEERHVDARKGNTNTIGKLKSAHKPHFCARKAGKVPSGSPQARKNSTFALEKAEQWLLGRPAEDKNLDFVLELAQNLGKIDQKRTKWALLSSKVPKN